MVQQEPEVQWSKLICVKKFQFPGSGDRFKSNAPNEQKNPDTVQVSVQYPGNEFVAAIPNGKPLLKNFIFHVIVDTLKMIR